ncbi:MAG: Tol-Pal system beta propeller repeat protein TolB [Gammaproteobacteria bacterium]|nr:Tol-Pal system beta propeller repeat protein TolB [Gammaproteobacteria bacterium]
MPLFSRSFLSFLLLLLLPMSAAQAQIEITSDGGVVRGIPTAIVPFKIVDGGSVEHQIDQIVAADLRASGKFDIIASNNYMSFPSRTDQVRFKDWRFIDAEALVIGEIWKLGGDNYELQFHVFDVAREQEIGTGKRIPNLRERDLRTAAHIVSDHIYTAFTGKPGAFNSRIAFMKRSEIEFQRFRHRLMVADWDGYGEQEVYASWRPLLSPSWSPDGSKIAFVAFSDGGSVIKVLELRTGQHKTIASFKGINSAPAWSPDGTQLAYSTSKDGSPDVYVYDTLTGQHRRVNTHYAIDTEPAWTIDGQNLLFTSSRTRKPQIYRTDLNGGATTRVTFEGEENANASFDYDGSRMVMVHEGGQIVVMDVESGELTWLTRSKFDESPSFSPNGDMVLYATEYGFEPALVVSSSDGRVRTRLEFISGDVREPAWSTLK